jgi:hypothetical protein
MTSTFIYTPNGYVNLDAVSEARFGDGKRYQIFVGDRVVDGENPDFGNTVVSIAPVNGEWDCIVKCTEDDGSESALALPVLAWGLTALGRLVPITPGNASGVEGSYALRKVGEGRVYYEMNTYETADAWLAATQNL